MSIEMMIFDLDQAILRTKMHEFYGTCSALEALKAQLVDSASKPTMDCIDKAARRSRSDFHAS